MTASAPLPGLTADRATLNDDARRLVQEAVDRRAPLGAFVLHLQPDGVSLERRVSVVAHLRAAGVRELARAVRTAVVPPAHVLVLVDTDGATALRLLPIQALT